MNRVQSSVLLTLVLGFASLIAIGISHLALTDIWRGETDTTLEWTALRLAAVVIVAFHGCALITMWRLLRARRV